MRLPPPGRPNPAFGTRHAVDCRLEVPERLEARHDRRVIPGTTALIVNDSIHRVSTKDRHRRSGMVRGGYRAESMIVQDDRRETEEADPLRLVQEPFELRGQNRIRRRARGIARGERGEHDAPIRVQTQPVDRTPAEARRAIEDEAVGAREARRCRCKRWTAGSERQSYEYGAERSQSLQSEIVHVRT